ncbi:MAG: hypothetical protein WCE23_02485 [Candidatus Binatus sp.]|uniref:hypothetical protein n=1 Tax=Candidatus Binatus sp. TaxID=2811406 RepID=UPI003C77DCE7
MLHRKNLWLAIVLLTAGFGAASAKAQPVTTTNYASAQQVESAFREHSFILGDDNHIADVRALNWSADRSIKLPFWFGTGQLVPPEYQPKKGDYYVISESWIVRKLGDKELLIRAGNKLQKPDAVLVTTKTRYKGFGMILPTIVQYSGTRTFTREDGTKVDIAVLDEVSLPARWTKGGRIPPKYARFGVNLAENLQWKF